MQVVDGADLVDGGVTELVRRAMGQAALHAGAGEPHGHGLVVVVAPDRSLVALLHRRTPEFAAPDDQGVLEHPAPLEVSDEGHAGPVHFLGAKREFLPQEAVVIPVPVVELDEAAAAFGEPAREQAVGGERTVARFAAIQREGLCRLARDVHEAGHAGLHLERHLILGDARPHFGVVHRAAAELVQRIDRRDVAALGLARDAGRVVEVEDGVSFGTELHALVLGGEEAAAPLARGDGLRRASLAGGDEDDEAGEVFGFGAESIGDPGAHARPPRDLRAGVHEHVRGVVVDGIRRHRADDADVVGHGTDVRQKFGELGAVLAVPGELELRSLADEFLALELGELLAVGEALRHALAVHLGESGLMVEELELRGASGHGQPDDALGLLGQGEFREHARRSGDSGAAEERR